MGWKNVKLIYKLVEWEKYLDSFLSNAISCLAWANGNGIPSCLKSSFIDSVSFRLKVVSQTFQAPARKDDHEAANLSFGDSVIISPDVQVGVLISFFF